MLFTVIEFRQDCLVLQSFLFSELFFQVTLIAQGDVPLSIVMTVCTTLGAVVLTPLLTKILAGTYVSVDAVGLSISTLQASCYTDHVTQT